MRRAWLFAVFAMLGAVPARAQIDSESLKSWGGTYLSDCGKATSPRVTIAENSIVVDLDDGRKVASTNATGSPSWYGNSAPENYIMTFTGDVGGSDQLIVDVFQANGETWAKVNGGGLGKAAIDRKYLRCAAAPATKATKAVKAPDLEPKPDTAAALPGAAEYAMDPAFAAPYKKALGKYGSEHWLVALEGPGPETKKVTIAGTEYVVLQACKDHDCADNNTTLLWSADKKSVYGKVRVAGKSALIGNPPKEIQKDLGELWWKTWGKPPQ